MCMCICMLQQKTLAISRSHHTDCIVTTDMQLGKLTTYISSLLAARTLSYHLPLLRRVWAILIKNYLSFSNFESGKCLSVTYGHFH